MSYMKSIQKAKAHSNVSQLPSWREGPIDILIISPVKGEPWFIYFRKDQVSKEGAFDVFKKFMKGYKHDHNVRWSITYDKKDRWHSVRHPARPARHATQQHLPAPPSAASPSLPRCSLPGVPSQIDNLGTPNALTLGAFLADEETKAVMRDKFCVKTLLQGVSFATLTTASTMTSLT